MENFIIRVLREGGDQYVCIDEASGWPVFDDELCNRTTRRSEEDMKQYAANLTKNGVKENFIVETA